MCSMNQIYKRGFFDEFIKIQGPNRRFIRFSSIKILFSISETQHTRSKYSEASLTNYKSFKIICSCASFEPRFSLQIQEASLVDFKVQPGGFQIFSSNFFKSNHPFYMDGGSMIIEAGQLMNNLAVKKLLFSLIFL